LFPRRRADNLNISFGKARVAKTAREQLGGFCVSPVECVVSVFNQFFVMPGPVAGTASVRLPQVGRNQTNDECEYCGFFFMIGAAVVLIVIMGRGIAKLQVWTPWFCPQLDWFRLALRRFRHVSSSFCPAFPCVFMHVFADSVNSARYDDYPAAAASSFLSSVVNIHTMMATPRAARRDHPARETARLHCDIASPAAADQTTK